MVKGFSSNLLKLAVIPYSYNLNVNIIIGFGTKPHAMPSAQGSFVNLGRTHPTKNRGQVKIEYESQAGPTNPGSRSPFAHLSCTYNYY